jgi:protein-S-isoprenylcysteine O-methyltransferase Ste14
MEPQDLTPLDRPNTLPWPPILYGIALLVPSLLQRLVPLPLFKLPGIAGDLVAPVGWALIATGIMVGYLAIRSFMAVGTAVHPTHPASRLVTFGLYNRTRNPMYVAAIIAFGGLALTTGNVFRMLAVPALMLALNHLAILREEAHLAAKFGEEWTAYSAKTPRWW